MRVMIVDDDRDIIEVMSEMLQCEGFIAKGMTSPIKALEELRKEPLPDVIILDMVMSEMSGKQFLEVKNHDPRIASIPVIQMSASCDGFINDNKGRRKFLEKPFDYDFLLDTLRSFQ